MKNKYRQTHRALALAFITLAALALSSFADVSAAETPIPRPDGIPADMTKPVQVFIFLVNRGMVLGHEAQRQSTSKLHKKTCQGIY